MKGCIEEYKPKSTIHLEGSDIIKGDVGSTVDVTLKAKITSMSENEHDGKKEMSQRLEVVSGKKEESDKDDNGKDKKGKMSTDTKSLMQSMTKGLKDA
jgi:hypothetical protein